MDRIGHECRGDGYTVDLRLTGRTAVVTGAAGGIGRAICLRLAAEGALVVAVDRDRGGLRDAVAEISAQGGTARGMDADVTDAVSLRAVAAALEADGGHGADILVCAAGIQTFVPVMELSPAEFDDVVTVNVQGVLRSIQAFAPKMRDRRRGAIVTVASLQGRIGNPLSAHYSASKAAVISVTKSFALELARDRVRVNSVAPGMIDTEMWNLADRELARLLGVEPGEPRRRRVAQIPLGRPGTPEDVAAAVAYLSSDDASYLTGECIHVTGGDLML